MPTTPYNRNFYQKQRSGSHTSAEVIVRQVLELVQLRSLVDVGCGIGTWSAQFLKHGVADVLGVDGNYVDSGIGI